MLFEFVEERDRRPGAVLFAGGDGEVEVDNGGWFQLYEGGIVMVDAFPVSGCEVGCQAVFGGDRGFEMECGSVVAGSGTAQEMEALCDQFFVPAGAVLFFEDNDGVVGVDSGVEAGGVQAEESHEGVEGRVFAGGGMFDQQHSQAHRFEAEVFADGGVVTGGIISFVKEEVDDQQDGVEPVAEIGAGWYGEVDTSRADLLFRAVESVVSRAAAISAAPKPQRVFKVRATCASMTRSG